MKKFEYWEKLLSAMVKSLDEGIQSMKSESNKVEESSALSKAEYKMEMVKANCQYLVDEIQMILDPENWDRNRLESSREGE